MICKIPPNLPLLKGGEGRFSNDYVNSILGPFINVLWSHQADDA
jgi:hypothetical protein